MKHEIKSDWHTSIHPRKNKSNEADLNHRGNLPQLWNEMLCVKGKYGDIFLCV